MKALLWKDMCIFIDVFLAGIALLCASYVLAFLLIYSDQSAAMEWSKVIAGGASLTRFTSMLICALLGSYAFAREGEDRSFLFLASLPARRIDIVLSKIIIAVSLVVSIWIISLGIMLAGMHAMGYEWDTLQLVLEGMTGYVASSVMAFGGAWFLSLFLGTAIGAAFAGLMLLIPVYTAQFCVNWYFNLDNPMFFHWGMVVFMLAAAILSIAAGAAIFLRLGVTTEEAGLRIAFPWRKDTSQPAAGLRALIGHRRATPVHALLWKDFRLIKSSSLIGLAVIALPYVIAAAGPRAPEAASSFYRTASLVSIALSALIFTFWSGHIMSAENASGSIAFLSYLPVPVVKGLASKLAVTFIPMCVLAAANLILLLAASNAIPGAVRFDRAFTWDAWGNSPFIIMGLALTNGTLMAFSLAWFLSAHYRRPALAIILGLLAVPLSMAIWAALNTYCRENAEALSPLQFTCLYSAGNVVLVLTLLMAGCFAALRQQRNKGR